MLNIRFACRSIISNWKYFSTTINRENIEEDEQCLNITRKIRLLGLRSNQPSRALELFDDFVYREKKKANLNLFSAAIQCVMITKDLSKGKEIHQFIQTNYPEYIDNLMLKQQLRFMYIKCHDQISAEKLFSTNSSKHSK